MGQLNTKQLIEKKKRESMRAKIRALCTDNAQERSAMIKKHERLEKFLERLNSIANGRNEAR